MSYGVTKDGWVSKPLSKIVESLSQRAKTQFGEQFPTTPESVFGQFANIFAAETKDTWDMGEGVASMQNRLTAEGIYLDYLARIAGLTRQKESGSKGQLLFVGDENTFVPEFTVCKDENDRKVITQEALVLNRASCHQTKFKVTQVVVDAYYSIEVEEVTYQYKANKISTEKDILEGLAVAISASGMETSVDEVENILTVTYPSNNNNLTTLNSDNITLVSVGSLVSAESALQGYDVNFSANSITQLVSSILTIQSVDNPTSFEDGRGRETDEELRARMDEREESGGTATKPAMETAVSEIEGVDYVIVEVNDTLIDNLITGVPAKHFETFVIGGDEDRIAEVMWKTKSLFGQTHGTIDKEIIDENGQRQSVKFSRPQSLYAWMEVRYSINSEETYPADGETQLKNAVVNFGNAMYRGEDYAPTKFYQPLYTVNGVYIEEIKIVVKTIEGEVPETSEYTTDRIPVNATQNLIFDASRIKFTT